jgi:prevent-host-death family protein
VTDRQEVSEAEVVARLATMAAYIDLNAVRAGIVSDPKNYRWCGYGEAVAGKKKAREGLAAIFGVENHERWRATPGRRFNKNRFHEQDIGRYFAVVFCLKYSYTFHQQEEFIMPAIKPISELRNYNTVLREVTADSPVFLTKNGHGRFAIVDIRAYEKLRTELDLMSALADGEESARKGGWVSMDSAMRKLGV